MNVFRSAEELRAALNALPPCSPDRVRVYRGQTNAYPPKPSGLRKHLDRDAVWRFYARRLLAQAAGKPFQGNLDTGELQAWDLWLPMLAQHYGAGSDYLDVTHGIDIAVWFALNKGNSTPVRATLGPPGPPSPEDLPDEVERLTYTPFEETGWFYVFDVPAWNMSALPQRGELVDLALGPTEYRSPRVLAQRGCLVRAEQTVNDGTLPEYLVAGTPFPISRPWFGPPDTRLTVEDVFPSPAVDAWFKRFLSVPMLPAPHPQTGEAVLRRPIPVMCIQGISAKYDGEITATETYFAPALLHKTLRHELSPSTVPILVESPLLCAYPPAASFFWNHDLLRSDIDDDVPVYDIVSKTQSGCASLRDVLFQFSTLEEAWWTDSAAGHEADQLPRAIRVLRDGEKITAFLMLQEYGSARIATAGPLEIIFDADTRHFVWRVTSAQPWKPFREMPLFDKPLLVALHLLRTVSHALHAQAFPSLVTDGTTALVRISAAGARLYRVADPHHASDFYVLRDANGDPYTDAKEGDFLTVPLSGSFADIPASAIGTLIENRI